MDVSRPEGLRLINGRKLKRRQGGGEQRISKGGGNGDVIHQRIKPDVGDVIRVERQRDAPGKTCGRPGNAEVFESVVLEKAQHFVATIGRLDELRVGLNVLDEPLLVRAQAEIIVVLHQLGHIAVHRIESAVGPTIFFRQKSLLASRVKATVLGLIKMPFCMQLAQNRLNYCLVPWL